MKTHEIISINESDLVGALKTMSLDQLEKHAKQIIKDMGSDNYAGLMTEAMQVVKAESDQAQKFQALQNTIRDFLPNEAVMSDIYARLAAILMMILSRKFSSIMAKS